MSLGQNDMSDSGPVPPAESNIPAPQSTMLGDVSPEATAPRPADPVANQRPESDAEPSSPPKKPEPKLCGVCGAHPGKYKCPRCSMPYCSVPCSKQHKENHPPDPPKPEPSSTATPNTNQPDPVQDDPYSILLDHRDTFQRLFTRYPSLAAELTRIQETTLPPSDTSNSLFKPAASIPGLGGHTGNKRQQPWTKEVGLRKGAAALRRARTDPSDMGDGVREFCELVRFLLNKRRDGVERLREEVVAEETRVIERLLREEGG